MPRINESYLNLRSSYLFAEIRRRIQEAFRRCPSRRVPGDRPRAGRRHPAAAAGGDRRPFTRPPRRWRVPISGATVPTSATSSCARRSRPTTSAPRGVTLGPRRDLRQRRRQERQREPPGDLRRRLRRGPDGPSLSRLRRQQRGGRALRQGRRRRPLRRHGLSVVHGGEQLSARPARSSRRSRLSPPPKQSHRRGGDAGRRWPRWVAVGARQRAR